MLEVFNGKIGLRAADGCELRHDWKVTSVKCWFVRVVGSNGSAAIPMEFARKCDALRAMESIKDLDSWEGTLQEISARLHFMTIEELKLKMVENLAW